MTEEYLRVAEVKMDLEIATGLVPGIELRRYCREPEHFEKKCKKRKEIKGHTGSRQPTWQKEAGLILG